MFFFLMEVPAENGQAAGGFPDVLILSAMIFLIFWLLVIRPQRKQEQKRQEMLNTMKKGDQVVTTGGIVGKVVNVKEDKVVLKIDESSNTKATFLRSAIVHIQKEKEKK